LIPFNVIATDNLDIPFLPKPTLATDYILPVAHCVQLKASNEVSVNRAILNLITVPYLRTAHVFQFEKNRTKWTVYESKEKPLAQNELRGVLVAAIQQIKHNSASKLHPVKLKSNAFITATKPIIKQLESFAPDDKVLVVLVFKEYMIVTGSHYDESTICRAVLNFSPRETKRVIRSVEKNVHSERSFSFSQSRFLWEAEQRKELLLIS
jgi:hypothetical protein